MVKTHVSATCGSGGVVDTNSQNGGHIGFSINGQTDRHRVIIIALLVTPVALKRRAQSPYYAGTSVQVT